DLVGVRVGGEDAARLHVEADVDRLRAGLNLGDHLVLVEVDDRDEVAARARDERAAPCDVDGDSLRIEPDGNLGHLPPGRARVDPARGPDGEGRIFSLAGRRHVTPRVSLFAGWSAKRSGARPLGSVPAVADA